MTDSLKKFLELQKEKAERDEQSNAIFKTAIEEVLAEKEPQPKPTPPEPTPEPEEPKEPEFVNPFPEPEPYVEPEPVPQPPELVVKPTEASGEIPEGYPQPITELRVTEIGKNSLKISWDKPEGAKRFLIGRRLASSGSSKWEMKTNYFYETEFVDTGLEEYTEYKYWIWARDLGDKATVSKPVTIRTAGQPKPEPKIDIPTDLTESVKIDIELPQDGSDVTKVLQEQLDNVPSGSWKYPTHVFLPTGEYWTEGFGENIEYVTRLYWKANIFIWGSGTTFYTKAPGSAWGGSVNGNRFSHRRHFCVHRSKNISVQGLTVKGSNYTEGQLIGTAPEYTPEFWEGDNDAPAWPGFPAYRPYWELEHAFDARGNENVIFNECHAEAVWGDGFYIGMLGGIATNAKILNCTGHMIGRQGIAVANDLIGLKIDNFNGTKLRRSGIDLEPHTDAGVILNVEISNCNIECQLTPFAAGGNGDVSNVYMHHNIYSGSGHSVYCGNTGYKEGESPRRHDWRFEYNTRKGHHGSSAPCHKFRHTDNLTFIGNNDSYYSEYYIGAGDNRGFLIVKDNNVVGAGRGGNKIRLWGTDPKKVEHSGNTPELEIDNLDAA